MDKEGIHPPAYVFSDFPGIFGKSAVETDHQYGLMAHS
jgi:hypothetical protein